MAILDMAKAHLQNVANKIEELNNQKILIDEEINKLSNYLSQGIEEINSLTQESTETN